MNFFGRLAFQWRRSFWFSRLLVRIGFYTMIGYYITVLFATFLLPGSANPILLLEIGHGLLEAAPASFAAAVAAAVICDLVAKYDYGL